MAKNNGFLMLGMFGSLLFSVGETASRLEEYYSPYDDNVFVGSVGSGMKSKSRQDAHLRDLAVFFSPVYNGLYLKRLGVAVQTFLDYPRNNFDYPSREEALDFLADELMKRYDGQTQLELLKQAVGELQMEAHDQTKFRGPGKPSGSALADALATRYVGEVSLPNDERTQFVSDLQKILIAKHFETYRPQLAPTGSVGTPTEIGTPNSSLGSSVRTMPTAVAAEADGLIPFDSPMKRQNTPPVSSSDSFYELEQ